MAKVSKAQQAKLDKKISKGKGQSYAAKLGIKTTSPLGYKVKADSNSWKNYDPQGRFNDKDINAITKQFKKQGFSQVGINNNILKIASSMDPSKIGRSAMKVLPSLNTGYSSDSPAAARKGFSGLGVPGYSQAGINYMKDSQGKGGKKTLTWTGLGDSLDVGKYAHRAGGVSTKSWTPGEGNGNRKGFGETIGQWNAGTGFNGKGGGQKVGGIWDRQPTQKTGGGKGGGGGGEGGGEGYGDYEFTTPETPELPGFASGVGSSGYSSAGGVRSKKSSWRSSGRALKGTSALKINRRTTAYGGGI